MLSDVGMPPDDLLPAHRQAITFTGGALLVLGPAGTGKTSILSERFRWLVGQGQRPDRIAIITPSQGRADAVREWLERGLQQGYDELVAATPVQLATLLLNEATGGLDTLDPMLQTSERFALLMERIDELP